MNTDKRMIVVESCSSCQFFRREERGFSCSKTNYFVDVGLDNPIDKRCPLPKWPSTDMGTIELFLKAAEEVGVSPTYLAAWLKSIGVEI